MHRTFSHFLIFATLLWISSAQDPVVLTRDGSIKGTRHSILGRNIDTFLGIPYAQPPIGTLRFKRPQPVSPRIEIFHAINKPVACPQFFQNKDIPWVDAGEDSSEDCLYLNVWAPSVSAGEEKKAVMFFIHGGGFYCGSSRLDVYDGSALASQGDVVVVNINYRLGVLGFLYLEDEDCPGNQGLADQNLALKWVRDNIEAFGGDPARITVFGESAGSMSTGHHLMSPLSRPLFRRAIMQSCTPNMKFFMYSTEEAVNVAKDFARHVGCGESVQRGSHAIIECLQDRDPMELLKGEKELKQFRREIPLVALPTYGEEFIPKDPLSILQPEDIKQTELLLGLNQDEGTVLLRLWNPNLFNWGAAYISFKEGQENLTKVGANFKGCEWKDVEALYVKNQDEDIRVVLSRVSADCTIVCPSVLFGEQFSDLGGKTYFYIFNHRPDNSIWPRWMGCTHFEEIQFVFGAPLLSRSTYSEEDVAMSKEIIKIWTTFAKSGSPPAVGESRWPVYTANHPVAIELSSQGMNKVIGPRLQHCNFWRCNMERSRQDECKGH